MAADSSIGQIRGSSGLGLGLSRVHAEYTISAWYTSQHMVRGKASSQTESTCGMCSCDPCIKSEGRKRRGEGRGGQKGRMLLVRMMDVVARS